MLLDILFAIIGALPLILAIIKLLILTYNSIIDWFRKRENIKNSDKDNIAFTIQEKMKNKQYKTVQGIFNKRTNEVVDAQEIHSNQVDDQINKNHRDNELVIYE